MKEETIKNGEKMGEYKRDESGKFVKGNKPSGRPKGVRDWKTDFNQAIKLVAKGTGKTESEIRTEFLARGIAEGRKGNFNFWKEIVERNYGKTENKVEIRDPEKTEVLQELSSQLRDFFENKKGE